MQPLTFDAVLIAGGKSRRMGMDKALIPLVTGELLWKRQWELLGRTGAGVRWLSVRAEQTWPSAEILRIDDQQSEAGPLEGVVGALRRTRATHLIVLAVDLPRITEQWFQHLAQRCSPGVGAVGRHPGGLWEPLAAIYPVAWLERWSRALDDHQRSLQRLLAEEEKRGAVQSVTIEGQQTDWFLNLNTPEERQQV